MISSNDLPKLFLLKNKKCNIHFNEYLLDTYRQINLLNNNTTVVLIKLNWGSFVGEDTRNIYFQINSFYEWGRTKDPMLITIQTIDKTRRCGQKLGI